MAGYNAGFSTKDSHLPYRNGNLITFFLRLPPEKENENRKYIGKLDVERKIGTEFKAHTKNNICKQIIPFLFINIHKL